MKPKRWGLRRSLGRQGQAVKRGSTRTPAILAALLFAIAGAPAALMPERAAAQSAGAGETDPVRPPATGRAPEAQPAAAPRQRGVRGLFGRGSRQPAAPPPVAEPPAVPATEAPAPPPEPAPEAPASVATTPGFEPQTCTTTAPGQRCILVTLPDAVPPDLADPPPGIGRTVGRAGNHFSAVDGSMRCRRYVVTNSRTTSQGVEEASRWFMTCQTTGGQMLTLVEETP